MANIESKQKLFLAAFPKKACNIAETCKEIGITRQTYYNWIRESPKFVEELDNATEALLDFAENRLIRAMTEEANEVEQVYNEQTKAIEYRNVKRMTKAAVTSVIFYLKTKGKKRGYIENSMNLSIPNPGVVKIYARIPDNNRPRAK